MSMATDSVLDEVREERYKQRGVHGWSPERDDENPMAAWAWLLANRSVTLGHPWPAEAGIDARRLLIEVAAIATAAVESLDRKARRELQDGR